MLDSVLSLASMQLLGRLDPLSPFALVSLLLPANTSHSHFPSDSELGSLLPSAAADNYLFFMMCMCVCAFVCTDVSICPPHCT